MKQGFRVAGCDITFDAEPPLHLEILGRLAELYRGAKPIPDEWERFGPLLQEALKEGHIPAVMDNFQIVDSFERAKSTPLGSWSDGKPWRAK